MQKLYKKFWGLLSLIVSIVGFGWCADIPVPYVEIREKIFNYPTVSFGRKRFAGDDTIVPYSEQFGEFLHADVRRILSVLEASKVFARERLCVLIEKRKAIEDRLKRLDLPENESIPQSKTLVDTQSSIQTISDFLPKEVCNRQLFVLDQLLQQYVVEAIREIDELYERCHKDLEYLESIRPHESTEPTAELLGFEQEAFQAEDSLQQSGVCLSNECLPSTDEVPSEFVGVFENSFEELKTSVN